jgi:predicted ester cyclase
MGLADTFKAWATAAAARDKTTLASTLASTVTYGDHPPFKPHDDLDAFLSATVEPEVKETYVDELVIDEPAKKVSGRVVHSTAPRSDGSKGEWSAIVFAHFDDDGKITRIHSLGEDAILDQIRQGVLTPPVGRSAKLVPSAPLLSTDEIDAFYQGYIDVLQGRTVTENFHKFVHDELSHDVTPLLLPVFIQVLNGFFDQVEGFTFEVKNLVCDEKSQKVGALVGLSGLPVQAFRGVEPTGKRFEADEYCVYSLQGGKIKTLWSVWDANTYKKSLSGEIAV